MDLFGFEEDLELHNSEIASKTIVPKAVPVESENDDESKLTISRIQELLCEDLVNDTISDQDTFQETETSIFEETPSLPDPPKLRSRRNRKIEKTQDRNIEKTFEETSTVNTENSAESEFMIPVVRAYQKPSRKKKVLRSIENTHVNDTLNSSSSKPKKNIRKKGKAKVKNNENERVDILTEEINNKFKEVENYKLFVE